MNRSKHCSKRQQKRAIPNQALRWLQEFGDCQKAHGGLNKRYFSKKSIRELESEVGPQIVGLCSKYLSVVLIENDDGKIVTAYWQH